MLKTVSSSKVIQFVSLQCLVLKRDPLAANTRRRRRRKRRRSIANTKRGKHYNTIYIQVVKLFVKL